MQTRRTRSQQKALKVVIDDENDDFGLPSSPLADSTNFAATPSPTLCLNGKTRAVKAKTCHNNAASKANTKSKKNQTKLTDADFDVTAVDISRMLQGVMGNNSSRSTGSSLEATPSPTLCLNPAKKSFADGNLSKYAEKMKQLLAEDITTEFHLSPTSMPTFFDEPDLKKNDVEENQCLNFSSFTAMEEQAPKRTRSKVQITLDDSDDESEQTESSGAENEPTQRIEVVIPTQINENADEIDALKSELKTCQAEKLDLENQLLQTQRSLSAQQKQCESMQKELEKANSLNLQMREIMNEFETVIAAQEESWQARSQALMKEKDEAYANMKAQLEAEVQDAVGIANGLLAKLGLDIE